MYAPPPPHHPKPAPPPDPSTYQFQPSTTLPESQGHVEDGSGGFQPPHVPSGGHGKGSTTSIDTPSMELFAANMDLLVKPVQMVHAVLQGASIAPGAFYHGYVMRTKVTGANGDAGLKEQMLGVLDDLANGLADLGIGMRSLSKKYTSIEDANGMSSNDLYSAITDAQDEFNALIKDAGGTPTSGSGSGSGS